MDARIITRECLECLWEERQQPNSRRDPVLSKWHGYTVCETKKKDLPLHADLFLTTDCGADSEDALRTAFVEKFKEIEAELEKKTESELEIEFPLEPDFDPSNKHLYRNIDPGTIPKFPRIPRFRETLTGDLVGSGNLNGSGELLQSGNLVLASDNLLGRGPIGTIGAFLELVASHKRKFHRHDFHDRFWLLSCNHILVRKEKTLYHHPVIHGEDDKIISRRHPQFERKKDHTLLDASVVVVDKGKNCYDPRLGLTHITPVELKCRDNVRKQGHGTGVTCGVVVRDKVKVAVLSGRGLGEKFYENECLVGSLKNDENDCPVKGLENKKFLDRGDSGALVVNIKDGETAGTKVGRPGGIVFAKTNRIPEFDDDRKISCCFPDFKDVGSPFGLVTPFIGLLEALSRRICPSGDHHLEMLKLECE